MQATKQKDQLITEISWGFISEGINDCEINQKVELVINGFETEADINATCEIIKTDIDPDIPASYDQRRLDISVNDFKSYDEDGDEIKFEDVGQEHKIMEEIKWLIREQLIIY